MLTALCLSMETFAETRGFAITYLHIANFSDSRNCPGGGNGNSGDVALRAYKVRGFSQSRIDALLSGKEGGNIASQSRLILERGIRNGEPANVQHYPESQPKSQFGNSIWPGGLWWR